MLGASSNAIRDRQIIWLTCTDLNPRGSLYSSRRPWNRRDIASTVTVMQLLRVLLEQHLEDNARRTKKIAENTKARRDAQGLATHAIELLNPREDCPVLTFQYGLWPILITAYGAGAAE